MRDLAVVLAVLVVLALGVWWQVYKYNECKVVGHSTFYCIMTLDRR